VEVDLQVLLILELAGDVWSTSRTGGFIPDEGSFHSH